MLSNSDYIKEKNKELKILGFNKIIEDDFNIKKIIKNINKIKLKQQAKMKIKFLNEIYDYQNTSRNIQKYKKNNLSFDYEYQRYDINIKYKDFFNELYGLEEDNYYFTNCGMSGLSSTFYALKKLGYKLFYQNQIYVETERLVKDYIYNDKEFTGNKSVLFLDSVSFTNIELILNSQILNYDLYILDTTLYVKDEIINIVDFFKENNKSIILIKSHTKMDMFGIEWATLGSIFISGPDEKLKKEVMNEIKIVLSFIGGFAYPNDIPLFWSKKEFYKVNYNRNKRIKENTDYIYEIITKRFPDLTIIKPYHRMFILIEPNRFIDYKTIEKDLHKYALKSKYKDIVCYADSFGLDRLGVSGYYENMSADTEVFRISTGDLPKSVLDEIIDEFTGWLEKYL